VRERIAHIVCTDRSGREPADGDDRRFRWCSVIRDARTAGIRAVSVAHDRAVRQCRRAAVSDGRD